VPPQPPFEDPPNPYTPEGGLRMLGLLVTGIRKPSRRRRKAFAFLGWWLALIALVVAIGVVTS
jgi:hypothetical protein